MNYLGRRLVVHRGESVVALEKSIKARPHEYELGGGSVSYLYDLYESKSQSLYLPIGRPLRFSIGCTTDEYMKTAGCWISDEEFTKIQQNPFAERDKQVGLITKWNTLLGIF